MPDGLALFPRSAPPAHQGVSAAIAAQDVYRGPEQFTGNERLLTVYVPIASRSGPLFSGVIAIDYSVEQMRQQDAPEQRVLVTLAIAAQRELNRRQLLADETFVQTISGIAAIVDKRDPYTAGHSQRVASTRANSPRS